MRTSIDQLVTKSRNKFLLANALSKRAKQIIEGSLPYVDDFNPSNPIVTAMKEIAAEKIKISVLEGSAHPKPLALLVAEPEKKRSLAKEDKKGPKNPKKKKKK